MSVFLEYSEDYRRQNYGLRNPKRGNQSWVPQERQKKLHTMPVFLEYEKDCAAAAVDLSSGAAA